MYYSMFDPTFIILIPAIIFTVYADRKVSHAFRKYSGIGIRRGITGYQAARMILDYNGLDHVPVEIVPGHLTDHYDPSADVMRLSSDVYNGASIASVSVAAHESGHAIQDGRSYALLRFRSFIAPAVNLVSTLSWPLMLIGLSVIWFGNMTAGNFLFDLGIIFFLGVVLFHLVTLPVEVNASRRAMRQLRELQIIDNAEAAGARRVLSAAAMTYIAALASSIANLIRILMIRGRD